MCPGTVKVGFERTGHVVNATLTADQWFVLHLPGGDRGYTRVIVNTNTGVETWIEAEFKDGKPQAVTSVSAVKLLPGATFGTKAEASRMWEALASAGTNDLFHFYLYGNYTGEKVFKDIAAATEDRFALTWQFDGGDIVQTRSNPYISYVRRWTPLARSGKFMAVMEGETKTLSGGAPSTNIATRVKVYIDRGKATPPAP